MVQRTRLTRRQFAAATAAAAMAPAVLKTTAVAQEPVTLKYVLWDANQQPAYQECADKFMAANPNIKIQIEQLGWDDYWTGLQTSMVSGSAADIFTNHLAKYPELAEKKQLVDIQPFVDRDKVDVSGYEGELADLWSRDGKRYGLPKDWDTIAVVYNKDMLDAAGIDPAVFEEWTWNPDDGGTYGEIIAKLTLDEAGNNGLSDAFDKTKVKQYGVTFGIGDAYGQSTWSHFACSTGWRFIDAPWTPPFHFDDERFIKTMEWLAAQNVEKGFGVPEDQITSLKAETVFASGKSALVFLGSWMINWVADNVSFPFGFGRLPIGPEGRTCMFNGLADSIWSGSKHQDEAWLWVKYLGSAEAQEIVGSHGAVFPAIPSAAEKAKEAYAGKGLDVSPYLKQAQEPNGTFLFPIVDKASEYVAIVQPAMQSIALGQGKASDVLPDMNDEVNDLY